MKEEKQKRKRVYLRGLRDGFPIGAGYFAVSFAVGITAKNAGLTVCAATVMSLLNLTSAGQAGRNQSDCRRDNGGRAGPLPAGDQRAVFSHVLCSCPRGWRRKSPSFTAFWWPSASPMKFSELPLPTPGNCPLIIAMGLCRPPFLAGAPEPRLACCLAMCCPRW